MTLALKSKTKLVDPRALKPAPYNPVGRTDPDDPGMRALVESISKRGIYYPPIVSLDNDIIEGHRRVAAAILLGMESIEVIVSDDEDSNAVYAELNATSRRMSTHDLLGIWLQQPLAVTPRKAVMFAGMADRLGRPLVKKMHESGLGPRAYQTAVSLTRYCGVEDMRFVGDVVRWMIKFGQVGQVAKVMAMGVAGKTLEQAVRDMRPLKLSAVLG